MIPVDFEGSNVTFSKPDNMTDSECLPIRVKKEFNGITECWQPNYDDLKAIAAGRSVYIQVMCNILPEMHVWVYSDAVVEIPLHVDAAEGTSHYTVTFIPSTTDIEGMQAGLPIFIKVVAPFLPPIGVCTLDEAGNPNELI